MKTGIIVINFGEPALPTPHAVIPFLERIFLQNSSLERIPDPEARRDRARELAQKRAPGLIEEYQKIGGSPLNAQAESQAVALQEVLRERGHDATTYAGYQFVAPFVVDVVERARADGVERLVGLPVYPLCGATTTVAALRQLEAAVEAEDGWEPEVLEIGGWHRHPDFYAFHADHVRTFVESESVDLEAADTALLFSIHGTPLKYLEEGNRYDRYVDEACAGIAEALGVTRYHMGYQNHGNRPVAWTQPDVEDVLPELDAERVVVVAVSFMHEQSETLAELDLDLKEEAEEEGLDLHRVPVPHDSPRFIALLADLVEAGLGVETGGFPVQLRRCLCRSGGTARCTNGMRLTHAVSLDEDARERA